MPTKDHGLGLEDIQGTKQGILHTFLPHKPGKMFDNNDTSVLAYTNLYSSCRERITQVPNVPKVVERQFYHQNICVTYTRGSTSFNCSISVHVCMYKYVKLTICCWDVFLVCARGQHTFHVVLHVLLGTGTPTTPHDAHCGRTSPAWWSMLPRRRHKTWTGSTPRPPLQSFQQPESV